MFLIKVSQIRRLETWFDEL